MLTSDNPIIRTGKAGEGTYGVVYAAETAKEKRPLVVKRNIIDEMTDFSGSLKELDLLIRLRGHPHIINLETVSFGNPFQSVMSPIAEPGYKEDPIHFIFEQATCDASQLVTKKKLSFPTLKRIFGQALLGVEYMHSQKILHRDLKPANLLWFDQTSMIKICDVSMTFWF